MRYTNKQILKITYPVLISLLMEHMIGLTDTAYLGRVGEVELGASALAGVYYLVIYMLGFGFSVGAQVLMARRNGEGEYKRIGEVFTQGGLFLFLLAAVLFTASNLLTPYLLHRMIGSEEVYRATMSYLDWRVLLLFYSGDVPCVLREYDEYEDLDGQFGGDGAYQRGLELYLDIR